MGRLSERDKWIIEKMKSEAEGEELFSSGSSSPLKQHLHSSSSSNSSFPNGFCSENSSSSLFTTENRRGEKRAIYDVVSSNVPLLPCFNSNIQQQQFLLSRNASSSPSHVSRAECSSSSSSPSSSSSSLLFCNGNRFSSSPDNTAAAASLYSPSSHCMKYGLCLCDSKSPSSYMINDAMSLSQSFTGLGIKEEENVASSAKMKGFDSLDSSGGGFWFIDGFDNLSDLDGNSGLSVAKHGICNDNVAFDIGGFQSTPLGGVPLTTSYDGNHTISGFENDGFVSMGSPLVAHKNDLYSKSDYLLKQGGTWSDSNREIQSHNNSPFTGTYHLNDPDDAFTQHCKMDYYNGGRRGGVIDSLGGAYRSMNPKLDLNNVYDPLDRSLIFKERMRAIKNNNKYSSLFSKSNIKDTGDHMEAAFDEDSYILQGRVLSHARNKEGEPFSCAKMNSSNEMMPWQNLRAKAIHLDGCPLNRGSWENEQRMISSYNSPFSTVPSINENVPSINSLSEFQGNIYLMAQDQNGCRWLQRIFDEGTSQDVQIIFNEIIDHVVELMLKPFGNYVIQKFLDVCNEEQRLQIVFMVTEEPGQLLKICLNTYGTRAVQKLIETLKTRQQISFVVLALKPGFLDLVKDQNGNHVIQRCLQCLSNEDNKFIFDAAAKFCVQIATHRHGCCVMQRCITHATGKHQEKLITEISKNALLLAQDPFGNYVVQYIIELKSPSAAVNLLSQFKRHYVHLSMQKFSSHVVEKCLKNLEESREQIVHELISVSRFDQLLQDPFANYVIQSALTLTKGPLRSSLVAAVRPYMILRTNPYSKRIFSRNLLKK